MERYTKYKTYFFGNTLSRVLVYVWVSEYWCCSLEGYSVLHCWHRSKSSLLAIEGDGSGLSLVGLFSGGVRFLIWLSCVTTHVWTLEKKKTLTLLHDAIHISITKFLWTTGMNMLTIRARWWLHVQIYVERQGGIEKKNSEIDRVQNISII